MGLWITYRRREALIDIGKSKGNYYNKNRKPKCFNCNIYGHMAKDYRKSNKRRSESATSMTK